MSEETIICITEEIIYTNDDNGYTVMEASYADGSDYFTAVGILPCISAGQYLKLYGTWTTHPDYGNQFKIEHFEAVMPADKEAMLRYLSSGIIDGVREATAKKIVDAFGDDTLNIIENDPSKLAQIKGITHERAMKISESFKRLQSVQRLVMFLQKYNISISIAMKVHEELGSKAVEVIQKNPYALSDAVSGVSFTTADAIAYSMGIPKNSSLRIRSGIKYIIQNAAYTSGHTYMPKSLIIEDSAYKLNVTESEAEQALETLIEEKSIIEDSIDRQNVCFLQELYEQEMYIASRLALMSKKPPKATLSAVNAVERVSALSPDISLAPEQENAVITAVSSACMVLTGGPGTGKTTTVNTIIKVLQDMKLTVALAAPTGRAAKRLSQITGIGAKTIHRLLGTEYINGVHHFSHNENNPLSADVIILDEVSMVDIPLMNSFLKAVKSGARIILCGDSDQLPSIGPGCVLRDIIDSGVVPVIRLTKIFRQAEQSLIIVNAHRINNGEMPDLSDVTNDFFCLRRNTVQSISATVTDLFVNRLPKSYGVSPLTGIQILSPNKNGDIGTINLNTMLQNAYNPHSRNKNEHVYGRITFREGDKVMQTKNNYDMVYRLLNGDESSGIFNGDMGIIERIDTNAKYMTIVFDDEKYVDYPFSGLDELDLSYAVTVHKSQGSEFPIVVVALGRFMPRLMTKNLLYTAVTRAKDIVILVGAENTIRSMVQNTFTQKRYTSLDYRLRYVNEYLKVKN